MQENPTIMTSGTYQCQPTFSPVALQQKEQIERIRAASGCTLYTYTFPTLFVWQADEQFEIFLRDDAFLVKN